MFAFTICLLCLALESSFVAAPVRASTEASSPAWAARTIGAPAAAEAAGLPQVAEAFPWSPEVRCTLNPARPRGLHPDALSALQGLALAHRITNGINNSSARGNVHSADGAINRRPYTGAVDISVRCLTGEQIKVLLGHLANSGFAAWYRKAGQDGWITGAPHVHAVWAGCRLKPVLQQQVQSWLSGMNGLASNRPYQFWQPSDEMKAKVQAMYHASN